MGCWKAGGWHSTEMPSCLFCISVSFLRMRILQMHWQTAKMYQAELNLVDWPNSLRYCSGNEEFSTSFNISPSFTFFLKLSIKTVTQ